MKKVFITTKNARGPLSRYVPKNPQDMIREQWLHKETEFYFMLSITETGRPVRQEKRATAVFDTREEACDHLLAEAQAALAAVEQQAAELRRACFHYTRATGGQKDA